MLVFHLHRFLECLWHFFKSILQVSIDFAAITTALNLESRVPHCFKLDCISVSDQRRPLLFDEPRTPSNPYNYLDINESEYEYQVILGIPSKEFRQILRYIREFATLVVNVIVTDAEVLPFRSGSEDLILTKDLRKSSKPGVLCGGLIRVTRIAFYTNRVERINQLFLQPDIITAGSPVLGYLTAVILIGPYGLSIIHHVHGIKAIAEFEVVFLMFNIGLELSVERLSSMKKYVFGLGSAQVLVTAVVVGLVSCFIAGQPSPAAIIVGNGLALSSTVVVLQDLAVVVLLILTTLISPNSSKGGGGVGFQAITEPLGLAVAKAIVAITAIIAGGRLPLRPIYKQVAENQNAEIFSANTLLVILGTGLLTARVESDIAPYRGLLLGLFFMMVGMSIDPKLFVSNFLVIMGTLPLLIGGKTILVAVAGRLFGISIISAIRVGLLLAPGGEFAFVAFGEAVNQMVFAVEFWIRLFFVYRRHWFFVCGLLLFVQITICAVRITFFAWYSLLFSRGIDYSQLGVVHITFWHDIVDIIFLCTENMVFV
ncbi:hypothetical protein ACSBR2_016690 [Camellia fascicularis]